MVIPCSQERTALLKVVLSEIVWQVVSELTADVYFLTSSEPPHADVVERLLDYRLLMS